MQKEAGESKPRIKRCRTKFRPYGTQEYLPILGRSKCKLQAQAGAMIRTMVYIVQGEEQPLLGQQDVTRLGIIKMDMQGSDQDVNTFYLVT